MVGYDTSLPMDIKISLPHSKWVVRGGSIIKIPLQVDVKPHFHCSRFCEILTMLKT